MMKPPKPSATPATAATMAELAAITNDVADGMRLAADLFAMTAYRAQRVMSAAAGLPTPHAPKMRSRYMREFTAAVTAKLSAIAGLFNAEEIDRLKKIGAPLADRLEHNDPDLMDAILKVLCMEPEDGVTWIRAHLGEIETRFAS